MAKDNKKHFEPRKTRINKNKRSKKNKKRAIQKQIA